MEQERAQWQHFELAGLPFIPTPGATLTELDLSDVPCEKIAHRLHRLTNHSFTATGIPVYDATIKLAELVSHGKAKSLVTDITVGVVGGVLLGTVLAPMDQYAVGFAQPSRALFIDTTTYHFCIFRLPLRINDYPAQSYISASLPIRGYTFDRRGDAVILRDVTYHQENPLTPELVRLITLGDSIDYAYRDNTRNTAVRGFLDDILGELPLGLHWHRDSSTLATEI